MQSEVESGSGQVFFYLGEDGSPDGLNVLDLGGRQESLELVGLFEHAGIVSLVLRRVAGHVHRIADLVQRLFIVQHSGETYGDLNAVVGEDEGRVGAGKLGLRHGGWQDRLTRGGWDEEEEVEVRRAWLRIGGAGLPPAARCVRG